MFVVHVFVALRFGHCGAFYFLIFKLISLSFSLPAYEYGKFFKGRVHIQICRSNSLIFHLVLQVL